MLLPIKVDLILKKEGYKQNLVWPGDFCNGKVIFILLTKVIALYVGSIAVDVWGLGLEFVSKRSTF